MNESPYRFPVFYKYVGHERLDSKLFDLPEDVFLLVFSPACDELVEIEPIGIYYYAGMRQYLWRQATWGEIDWDRKRIRARAMGLRDFTNKQKLIDFIDLSRSGAPSPTDTQPPIKDAFTKAVFTVFGLSLDKFLIDKRSNRKYCRAIYNLHLD